MNGWSKDFGFKSSTLLLSCSLGFLCGFSISKFGKYMILTASFSFLGMKYLESNGYIKIYWEKMLNKENINKMQQKKDSLNNSFNIIMKSITNGSNTTIGFVIGIILGIIF